MKRRVQTISKQQAEKVSLEEWTELCKQIEVGLSSQRAAEHASMAKLIGVEPSSTDMPWLKKLQDELHAAMAVELSPYATLLGTYPTKLKLMLIDAMRKHSSTLKRQIFGPNATRIDEFKTYSFRGYDVEQDIERTNHDLEAKKRELFGLEIDFMMALEDNSFAKAEAYLGAIRAQRGSASASQRNEVENWQRELALRKPDLAMYLDAWNRNPVEGVLVKEIFFHDFHILLTQCVMTSIAVAPTVLGQRKMATLGQVGFGQEQTEPFMKIVLEKLMDRLCEPETLTVESFVRIVEDICDEVGDSFVRINPLVRRIQPIWRSLVRM